VQVNVATLLQEHIGSSRDFEFDAEPVDVPAFDYHRVVDGTLHLVRTERGVLVHASLHFCLPLECARCLEPFIDELDLDFDEEFVLGHPHPVTRELPEREEGDFLIDDHWHLDLSEAVRQYEQSAVPLIALCRPDCPGFVAASSAVPSEPSTADRRWSALSGLAARLHEEETDGAPEA
jgi:DUF177 domain-containing protein